MNRRVSRILARTVVRIIWDIGSGITTDGSTSDHIAMGFFGLIFLVVSAMGRITQEREREQEQGQGQGQGQEQERRAVCRVCGAARGRCVNRHYRRR
ncbi:hypothetical protein [Streptomyces sp. MA5143a]|uniref:hypothetical protein n=1 Tax=Streptomyces sp. MA5143a TaxID=2083010 RepID=UPI0015E766D1|nr:hypothetical protein [Streptomyces sp. MA5143a]